MDGGIVAPVVAAAERARRRVDAVGLVQGVGFRPFVWRLASSCGVDGRVANTRAGVVIEVEGDPADLDRFTARLVAEAPAPARVDGIDVVELAPVGAAGFAIDPSEDRESGRGLVPPDLATCADCRAELLDPTARRHRYPFTNCARCGPRATVILDLPYDRAATTMAGFAMCADCRAEYDDPADRRHHAQPVACPACGPQLRFEGPGGVTSVGSDAVLGATHAVLAGGGIVAMQGVGGFHLLCDARDDAAVRRLRDRKWRPDKPLAVLVADVDAAAAVAELTPLECDALVSPAGPIVLARGRVRSPLARSVSAGSPLVGVMVASNPLHHLLFEPVPGASTPVPTVLVATSGNRSGEPVCIDAATARERLGDVADAFVTHDRPIVEAYDDSVVRVLDGAVVPLRRARGLAPLPVRLAAPVRPTFAAGGDLRAAWCLADGNLAWVGPHVGDMGTLAALDAFERGRHGALDRARIVPEVTAIDAHPGYHLSGWARRRGAPATEVQHHHAHAVSLMADAGLDGTTPLLAFVFDGTGYAPGAGGGELWGGEVLLADPGRAGRVGHLRQLPLPGGDAGVTNPCRTAVALLDELGIPLDPNLAPVDACRGDELDVVVGQRRGGYGVVPTTSVGRLFDVVASLLGIRHRITYDGQAAIELEASAGMARGCGPGLRFAVGPDRVIDHEPVIRGLLDGLAAGEPVAELATAFHGAVADAVAVVATSVRAELSAGSGGRGDLVRVARHADGRMLVGLTGGVFQNALLVDRARRSLETAGFAVLTHRQVPPNDGGISLGQAVVAGTGGG